MHIKTNSIPTGDSIMDTQEKPETQAQNTDNPHDKGYKKDLELIFFPV